LSLPVKNQFNIQLSPHTRERGKTTKKQTSKKALIASVTVPSFASTISNTILTLLLADIAIEFFGNANQTSIGIAGQLSTVNSIGEAVIALLMGFLVIKFRHKALYLSGVFLVVASAIGNFLAPNLLWMQAFYFLEGTGSMMTAIIAATIIGDILPMKQKGKVISYVVAAAYLVPVAGTLLINYIAEVPGWRYNYLLFVLPAAVTGLLISTYGIPAKNKKPTTTKNPTINSFKHVFVSRSAVSCLLCQFFFVGSSIAVFTLPFFRTQFSLPRTSTAYILIAASSL
jgi:MFS family permease